MSDERLEVRITGFGGQGVVLAAYIIGRASIDAGKHATMIQSFGPEARGSSCSATLVISGREVLYPYIQRPSILVAMSADGYEKYRDELSDDGTLIYESDLVTPSPAPSLRSAPPSGTPPSFAGDAGGGAAKRRMGAWGIPSKRIAESIGKPLVQNIVMVGFIAAATEIVPRQAMREAVRLSVPAGTEEINLKAFDAVVNHFEVTSWS